MVKKVEVLAIIPARGGSKGIPRKNIRDFAGYPLIAYSISAALQSRLVTRVVVSTDDEEIARIARSFGADVPFLRPDEISADETTDLPVFMHALDWLSNNESYNPDIVVQLRPTSPVRPLNCVDDAIEILLSHPEADSVRGIVPSGQNPYKMWIVDPGTSVMKPLLNIVGVNEPYNAPRQQLPPTFWQTGHVDAIRTSTILDKHSMSGETILGLIIDPQYTVDLDNLRDWERAAWLVNNARIEMVSPGRRRRPLPEKIDLVVFDFDGTFTDNRVWVNEEGKEQIAANRMDSHGIKLMRNIGIPAIVISTEINPVVTARCNKMHIPALRGIWHKDVVLTEYLEEQKINPQNVVFLGNDINDVPVFPIIGCAVVVGDSHISAIKEADIILTKPGGHGAVREFCDMIIEHVKERS
jgi:YrbI family 3-deoxy-D-manno-octulosonate 8-phosphate phosphatase